MAKEVIEKRGGERFSCRMARMHTLLSREWGRERERE